MGTEQIVVVTGASAGVGRAVARQFGRRGATVALLSDVSQKAGRVNKVSKPEWQRRRF